VLFAFTDTDGWHVGIGDPTPIGWITVAAYFLAAFFSFQACRSSNLPGERKQRFFWGVLTVLLVLLGINKQLDLQTWLTLTMRNFAIHEGIYEERRLLQGFFIILVALSGLAALALMGRLVQAERLETKLGLAGLCFVVVFVIIRAASFHHIDTFLKYDIGGFRMNWVLELGGIIVIGIAAFRAWRGPAAASHISAPHSPPAKA
jgi:hypothetical protein